MDIGEIRDAKTRLVEWATCQSPQVRRVVLRVYRGLQFCEDHHENMPSVALASMARDVEELRRTVGR